MIKNSHSGDSIFGRSNIFYKGKISKVSNNINLVFKNIHSGKYTSNEVSMGNNYPIDAKFAYIEVVTDKDENFCMQIVYSLVSDMPGGARSTIPISYMHNRIGMINNGMITWGKWAEITSNVNERFKMSAENYNWIKQNLFTKVEDPNDEKMVNRGINGGRGIVPSLDVFDEDLRINDLNMYNRIKSTSENESYSSSFLEAFKSPCHEFFTYKYLGELNKDNLKDFKFTFSTKNDISYLYADYSSTGTLTKRLLISNHLNPLHTGYYIIKPGVDVGIPTRNNNSYGILKIYNYPMQTRNAIGLSIIPSQTQEWRAGTSWWDIVTMMKNRLEPKYASRLNRVNIDNSFHNSRVGRYMIYEQFYPAKMLVYFDSNITNKNGIPGWNILIHPSENIENSTSNAENGWYDIGKTYNLREEV